jgi:hypothetical protein
MQLLDSSGFKLPCFVVADSIIMGRFFELLMSLAAHY